MSHVALSCLCICLSAPSTRYTSVARVLPMLFDASESTPSGERRVLVKLARRYNHVVHRAVADAGLAPQLLEDPMQLPGGWVMVKMQLLDGWQKLTKGDVRPGSAEGEELEAAATAIIASMHAVRVQDKGVVHGDCRPNNIMFRYVLSEIVASRFAYVSMQFCSLFQTEGSKECL